MRYRNDEERKRMKAGEEFDRDHPVAERLAGFGAVRYEMRPEAYEDMMKRLYAAQAAASGARPSRGRFRWRYALVPAAAVLCVVTLLLVLVVSRGGEEQQKPRGLFATVQAGNGDVQVLPQGGSWRKVKPGEKLAPSSLVRTGKGASASVQFPDGSIMRMTDSSEARIGDIGAKTVAVQHISGGTYHRVTDGTEYQVENSGVHLNSAGAAFNVENRVPGNLEIVTVAQSVNVEIGQHQPLTVNEGEVMVVALADEKKAEVQPVSRERLEEGRLLANAEQDAREGYNTGVYEKLDVPLAQEEPEEEQQEQPEVPVAVELGGTASESGASLQWVVGEPDGYDTLVLLRSIGAEPTYPDNEIARYSDTSITSAADNSVLQEQTYQYRMAALKNDTVVGYSNTLVLTIPKAEPEPVKASVSLIASASTKAATLEWSVSDAPRFEGYTVERVVQSAPPDSRAPVGSTDVRRITTSEVLYTYQDTGVQPGVTYTYRVGLVVDGVVVAYSNSETVTIPSETAPKGGGLEASIPGPGDATAPTPAVRP